MENNDMLKRKSWEEFRATGLLWFINTILHAFGWVLLLNYDNNSLIQVYPARTKFRGFSTKDNDTGYERIASYMKNTGSEIYQEILDDKENN